MPDAKDSRRPSQEQDEQRPSAADSSWTSERGQDEGGGSVGINTIAATPQAQQNTTVAVSPAFLPEGATTNVGTPESVLEPAQRSSLFARYQREVELQESLEYFSRLDDLARKDRREEFKRQMIRDDIRALVKLEADQRIVAKLSGKTQLPIAADLAKAVGISGRATVAHLQNLGMCDAKMWSEVPWEYAVSLYRRVHGQEESSEAVCTLYLNHGAADLGK